ncbi:MAG: pilin [Patescibacteria group bacterium]|nr:pilin [Patescibacteria group bacterium]
MPKKFPKIFTLVFLLLIILQTGAFLFFTLFYTPTKAEAKWKNPTDSLQIKIPGMDKFSEPAPCPDDPTKTCVPWIGEYIAGIYNYAIGIVGILAAVVLMVGGVIWLTAGGSPDKVNEAKAWIGAALSGLVLALTSYMILYQVNPDLVKLNPLGINVVTEKKGEAGTGCEWKILTSETWEGEIKNVTTKKCEDFGLEKQDNYKCGEKKNSQADTCCCPPCPAECQAVGCSYCTACKDCVTLTVLTKPGNGRKLTASLSQKLTNVFSKKNNWQVTEAWPPSQGHAASCHTNGTCADINFLDRSTDPGRVKELYDILVAAGLSATYESPNCGIYPGVNCGGGSEYTNAEHFHVN